MSRFENIAVFEDTVSVCEKSSRLIESIKASRKTQIFIGEEEKLSDASKAARFEKEAEIIISKKRTFEAAQNYAKQGEKVAVLNFASSTNPGGGVVNGAGAQEECLCRISTLYFTLDTDENWKRFYEPHRKARTPLHNDDILYTKNITVFKSDTTSPKLLPESEWYDVDVITCAAPNLRENPSNRYNSGDGDQRLILNNEELYSLHEKRDARIFDVAVSQNIDVLVLGAFGCGAFMNDPKVVSKVMLNLEKKYAHSFKTIEFAVYCPPYDDSNYRAFMELQ